MSKRRSARLRKKLCVGEFKELGFDLDLNFPDDADDASVDAFYEAFFSEAIDPAGLIYGGGDDSGFVCCAGRGSVTAEQRAAVEQWLSGAKVLKDYRLGELVDAWYPGINGL
ncbi:MAG TPA: 50S ribosome-binding protein YggL [Denitromonas sp.]|uniref:YggL 50S ribosome-binding family protein n=1 Tax=Denitromonas sp. TaxID=2734609 RepID=UPI001D47CE16|nr:DUF469 family protein [Rhodocyclaceae bacterium]MCP5222030.1 DUF469 family protein [Zoogloeaceae bacterium]HPR06096.1 50S ribosome-binding protein YggL [Denitromonas sp.]HQU89829.1 50S ribosome-binding protein YggL [Denitromonas sp.]HQV16051.1 50S ribosome-binding protein YggL [Denitromonas sp.]